MRRLSLALRYLLLTVFAVIVIFPLYITFLDSMLSLNQIIHTPPVLFSIHLNWHIFVTAWNQADLSLGLMNSFLQSILTVSGVLVTSVLAGYSFAYLRFPFKKPLFILCLATLMIPFEVVVIVNLQTVTTLHLDGNLGGLVVPFLASGFGIFLLREAFLQIPKEMREAAVIDGYGNFGYLWKVAVPMARPSIAALAVFSFLGTWNSYLWPNLMADNAPGISTIQVLIKTIGGTISSANIQIAAAAIAVLPLLLLLVFFQKQLIRSLSAGAVK
jgi:sn-glycerol 3-phosphate transport system permease protein